MRGLKIKAVLVALLFGAQAAAQPTEGSWTANNFTNDADFNGTTLTVDAGSDRAFVLVVETGFAPGYDVTTITVGGVAPTSDGTFVQSSTERMAIYFAVWDESAIGSMSGSDVAFDTNNGDGLIAAYATHTGVDQTTLGTLAYTGTNEADGVASLDVTSTSTSSDLLCAFGMRELTGGALDGWDTLTERWDLADGAGQQGGGACGTGGDNTTTITPSASDDMVGATLVFPEAAATDDFILQRRRLQ